MNKDFLLKKKWLTIFFATILGVCLPLFSGCSEDDDEYVEPNLTIEPADGFPLIKQMVLRELLQSTPHATGVLKNHQIHGCQ